MRYLLLLPLAGLAGCATLDARGQPSSVTLTASQSLDETSACVVQEFNRAKVTRVQPGLDVTHAIQILDPGRVNEVIAQQQFGTSVASFARLTALTPQTTKVELFSNPLLKSDTQRLADGLEACLSPLNLSPTA